MAQSGAGIAIAGWSVAAATAAHCLCARGLAVGVDPVPPPRGDAPVVMLGAQAQALARDVFAGHHGVAALLSGAHRIVRRVVRWGDGELRVLPHTGLVLGGDALAHALCLTTNDAMGPERFTLMTSADPGDAIRRFGRRTAAAVAVRLAPAADPQAVLVEALDAGWLFLIPTGTENGWLLAVGAEPDAALGESRLVARAIDSCGETGARFDTAPRLHADPAAHAHLVIGSAALAFDPICGDGTATAIRGGILGAAVAAEAGCPEQAALAAHYRAMLIAAMRRHLGAALPFYLGGGRSDWWRDAADATARGVAWCTRELAQAGAPRFVLAGDRLVPRAVAA